MQRIKSLGCVVPVHCAGLLGPSQSLLCPPFPTPIHKPSPDLNTTEISERTSLILWEAGLSGWLWLIKLCISVFSNFFIKLSLEHIWVTIRAVASLLFFLILSVSSHTPPLTLWTSLQSREEQPHVWILVADWFLESWCEATSNMPGVGECDLASLCNPLQLSHRMSLFFKSTYYLTLADAIRQNYGVFGMQFIKTYFGASWRGTGWKC